MSEGKNLEAALESLPHGPEFRFVDEVVELDAGRSGVGIYRVRGDEAFLAGHFPGDPLMPGVILVEAIAQLAGVVAQCDPERRPLANLPPRRLPPPRRVTTRWMPTLRWWTTSRPNASGTSCYQTRTNSHPGTDIVPGCV